MPGRNHYPTPPLELTPQTRVLTTFNNLSGRTSNLITSTTPPEGLRIPRDYNEQPFAKGENEILNDDGTISHEEALQVKFSLDGIAHTAAIGLVVAASRQHRNGGGVVTAYSRLDQHPHVFMGLDKAQPLPKFIPQGMAKLISRDVSFGTKDSVLKVDGRSELGELPHIENTQLKRTIGLHVATLELFTSSANGQDPEVAAAQLLAAHEELTQPIPPEEQTGRMAQFLGRFKR